MIFQNTGRGRSRGFRDVTVLFAKPKASREQPKASRKQPKASREQTSSARKGGTGKRAKKAANQ